MKKTYIKPESIVRRPMLPNVLQTSPIHTVGGDGTDDSQECANDRILWDRDECDTGEIVWNF